MPLSNAETCKNYRNRKKDALKIIKKTPSTSAERSRMYRLRKKQLTQGIKSSVNEVLYTPSTSNSRMTLEPLPQPVNTGKYNSLNSVLIEGQELIKNEYDPIKKEHCTMEHVAVKEEILEESDKIEYDPINKEHYEMEHVAIKEEILEETDKMEYGSNKKEPSTMEHVAIKEEILEETDSTMEHGADIFNDPLQLNTQLIIKDEILDENVLEYHNTKNEEKSLTCKISDNTTSNRQQNLNKHRTFSCEVCDK